MFVHAGLKANEMQLAEAWSIFKDFAKLPVRDNETAFADFFSWECVAPDPKDSEEGLGVQGGLCRNMGSNIKEMSSSI